MLILEHTQRHPDNQDVDNLAENVIKAIAGAIESSTPNITISLCLHQWWCTTKLNPLNGHANNLCRREKQNKVTANCVMYCAAQYVYQQTWKDSKVSHWHTYLAQIQAKDLFTVSKYTTCPPATQTQPPLCKQCCQLTSNPEDKLDLLFQAKGGQQYHETSWMALLLPPETASTTSSLPKTFTAPWEFSKWANPQVHKA